MGLGNFSACGNSFAVAGFGLEPAAEGIAFTLYGRQSVVGLAGFNLSSCGSSALCAVQVEGDFIHNRIGIGGLAAFFAFTCSTKVCNEVGDIKSACIITGNAGQFRCAKGVVGAVCAPVEVNVFNITGERHNVFIPLQGLGGFGGEDNVVMGAALYHFQVSLGFTLHEVDSVTAGNFFYINIHCFISIRCGCIVELVHFAGHVQVLAEFLLMNEELICLANLRLYSNRICADSLLGPLGVQGVGLGNFSACGNSLAVAGFGQEPAFKGVAFSGGSRG